MRAKVRKKYDIRKCVCHFSLFSFVSSLGVFSAAIGWNSAVFLRFYRMIPLTSAIGVDYLLYQRVTNNIFLVEFDNFDTVYSLETVDSIA